MASGEQAEVLNRNRERLVKWQKEHYARPANGEVRLHLGSGSVKYEGYLNVDLYNPSADVKADLTDLTVYTDGSVDEICCHHALEHVPQRKLEDTLREWWRVLKPGGHLDLALPDIDLVVSSFLEADEQDKWNQKVYQIYGWQVPTDHADGSGPIDEGQFHRAGISASRLKWLLGRIGFRIIEMFHYNANGCADSTWVYAEKVTEQAPPKLPSALEQDVVMGVFTHRTTYLPALLDSCKKHLPHIPLIVKIQDKPIVQNMYAMWQEFRATDKRYWVYLDDDIQFLSPRTVHNAIAAMIENRWACCNVYSDFDPACLTQPYPEVLRKIPAPATRRTTWATGYFVMVDRELVGHIQPDLNLPYPNCSADTSYSCEILAEGHMIGMSGDVVYHLKKQTPVDWEAVKVTNEYLMKRWGEFYFRHIRYDGNVVNWKPGD